jgi:hypothetical protein
LHKGCETSKVTEKTNGAAVMKSSLLSLLGIFAVCGCRTAERATVPLANTSAVVSGGTRREAATAASAFTTNAVPAQAVQNHWLPDSTMTPGAIFEGVTDAEVCVPGYSRNVRNVPASVKREVYAEYGMQPGVAPCPCEVDHLISLELCGSNEKSNLWPQPYAGEWNARQKDKLENFLHKQVCEGNITLEDAQHKIARDWIQTYLEYGLDKE